MDMALSLGGTHLKISPINFSHGVFRPPDLRGNRTQHHEVLGGFLIPAAQWARMVSLCHPLRLVGPGALVAVTDNSGLFCLHQL
ncbi:hypothetical protein QJS10_CPA01g00886 [Acorus calamus]|uniref:Uncharacterized protein n=1 Tax=Acorus calamus TaxID=4465 RepID=A0AAV9FF24_ACOCL|nr:hypothetical protein QJS10_CPA01g00886 [Acorus calamus]